MAGRRSPGARSRGGVGIQALRQSDARVGAAVAALLGSALLATAAALGATRAIEAAAALGAAGVASLGAGLARRRGPLVTAGLALSGAAYGVSVLGEGVEALASVAAGGLLLVAELAFWAIEPGAPVRLHSAATARRAAFSAALAAAATVLAALLLAAASAPLGGGEALGFAGLAALVAVGVVAAGLLHSLRDRVE